MHQHDSMHKPAVRTAAIAVNRKKGRNYYEYQEASPSCSWLQMFLRRQTRDNVQNKRNTRLKVKDMNPERVAATSFCATIVAIVVPCSLLTISSLHRIRAPYCHQKILIPFSTLLQYRELYDRYSLSSLARFLRPVTKTKRRSEDLKPRDSRK